MATTMSSFRISIDPRARKYKAVSTSPQCTNVSPGGAWVVLNRIAKARKHPLLAPLNALQSCSKDWFRCRQISAWRHSGKPFSTYRDKENVQETIQTMKKERTNIWKPHKVKKENDKQRIGKKTREIHTEENKGHGKFTPRINKNMNKTHSHHKEERRKCSANDIEM